MNEAKVSGVKTWPGVRVRPAAWVTSRVPSSVAAPATWTVPAVGASPAMPSWVVSVPAGCWVNAPATSSPPPASIASVPAFVRSPEIACCTPGPTSSVPRFSDSPESSGTDAPAPARIRVASFSLRPLRSEKFRESPAPTR